MTPDNRQILEAGMNAIGLVPTPEVMKRLTGYHDFLLEYNQNVNLTGLADELESVIGNLLNALAPWRHVDGARATADIGSGGGLPGIPLAIALAMPRMWLVESKRKKCDFLDEAVKRFAPGVEVIHADAREVKRSFGQVVSIAYGSLAKLLDASRNMRAPGTRLLAWKGKREVIDAEIAECPKSLRGWQVEKFSVPGLDAERHMCVLEL